MVNYNYAAPMALGGKRITLPLSHGRKIFRFTIRRVRSKAPSLLAFVHRHPYSFPPLRLGVRR
jgi:hypothetical protein